MGKKKLTTRQRNEIYKLRENGLSYRKIAKIYDLDEKTVYEMVQKNNDKSVDK